MALEKSFRSLLSLQFGTVLLNCFLSWFDTKVPVEQLEWTFMLHFSPSFHPNPSPLLLQRNSRLCSFCDTAWRPQGARGRLLDSSCCPGAAAQRTPVPVLPSSQGSPGGCTELRVICWTCLVVPAAASMTAVPVLPISSELGEEEVRALGEG